MKIALILLTAVTLSTKAAQIQFALSPPGTGPVVGLSPSNEVPVVTNSSGSGNTIKGGIVFDSATGALTVNVGYGSAAGFTDLSGIPVAMHIHSPAGVGTNAGVLVNLLPFNVPATNPVNGGTIIATGTNIIYPTNAVSDLLAGLAYINIHTVLNPGGEIRGQLIPLISTNSPPSVTCPTNTTAECGTLFTAVAIVSDPDGDAVTVVWSVNGLSLQTNTVAAGGSSANVSFQAILPLGTNVVTVTATDSVGNSTSCSAPVRVVDTTPPVISNVIANPNVIWPPNHKMVAVRVQAQVTDACGPATWKILSVTSSEAAEAKGSGHTALDWKITGDHALQLRAERSGSGNGRVYTITIQATDQSGNTSRATVTVTVPHDHGNGKGSSAHSADNSHTSNPLANSHGQRKR